MAFLARLSAQQWGVLVVAAALYVGVCVRVALRARRFGRNPVLWFVITLFLTAIPATVVYWMDQSPGRARGPGAPDRPAETGPEGGPLVRCRHCGRLIPAQARSRERIRTCPSCGMVLGEGDVA